MRRLSSSGSSMPHAIVAKLLGVEEALSVAMKAGASAVDEVGIGAGRRQRLQVMSAAQDGLDGAVVRGVVREGALTGRFQSRSAIGIGEVEDPLSSAQALDDAIRQELLDERNAMGTDGLGP